MKTTITLLLSLLLIACTPSSKDTDNKETPSDETTTEETTAPAEETAEQSTADLLIGTWVFEDPKIKIVQIINYHKDGTYTMKMGDIDIDGTWELTDGVLITKSRPDAPGQKKTITKIDAENLWTYWEPQGGVPREMKYVRKK